MADLEWTGPLEPASLRRALRVALRQQAPELRVIAEDFLAEESAIDLLAVGAEGELVSVRISKERDQANAALLFTRGLADLTWLRLRHKDLLKLAPGLGLELGAEPRSLLLCPSFGQELRRAAENLPDQAVRLITFRPLRQQGQLTLLLEPQKPALTSTLRTQHEQPTSQSEDPEMILSQPNPEARRHPAPSRLTDPPSSSTFRTGLRDEDLRLEPTPANTEPWANQRA